MNKKEKARLKALELFNSFIKNYKEHNESLTDDEIIILSKGMIIGCCITNVKAPFGTGSKGNIDFNKQVREEALKLNKLDVI
jgi:hypothetical protein